MMTRSTAAPPPPWSRGLAEPTIHESTYVHPFSQLIGDVRIGANVLVAPGASIRADEGFPFVIGSGSSIQDGGCHPWSGRKGEFWDTISSPTQYGLAATSVLPISRSIHGPAYVGDECFVGFRSTIFNARLGQGCVVMMHALIQDVEISSG